MTKKKKVRQRLGKGIKGMEKDFKNSKLARAARGEKIKL